MRTLCFALALLGCKPEPAADTDPAEPPPRPPAFQAVTGGGGVTVSGRFKANIAIGTPAPAGSANSATHAVRVGPKPSN